MNMSVTEFFNLIARHLKFRRKKAVEPKPFRDWEIILGVMAIVLVILFAAGAFLFYSIAAGRIFASPPESTTAPQTLDRAALDGIVNFYAARDKNFEALGGTTTSAILSATTTSTQAYNH